MNTKEESLLTSSVPRTLETRSKILGLELSDVLVLFLNLSLQNLIFGGGKFKMPMVFGSSILLALVLFVFKRGKPDLFLQHYAEHLLSPLVREASGADSKYRPHEKGRTA